MRADGRRIRTAAARPMYGRDIKRLHPHVRRGKLGTLSRPSKTRVRRYCVSNDTMCVWSLVSSRSVVTPRGRGTGVGVGVAPRRVARCVCDCQCHRWESAVYRIILIYLFGGHIRGARAIVYGRWWARAPPHVHSHTRAAVCVPESMRAQECGDGRP